MWTLSHLKNQHNQPFCLYIKVGFGAPRHQHERIVHSAAGVGLTPSRLSLCLPQESGSYLPLSLQKIRLAIDGDGDGDGVDNLQQLIQNKPDLPAITQKAGLLRKPSNADGTWKYDYVFYEYQIPFGLSGYRAPRSEP